MFSRRLYRTARWLLWAATCIYVVPIHAESGAAKVITLNGQVSVLRDDAPWVLNVGDAVEPRQIIITGSRRLRSLSGFRWQYVRSIP